MSSSLFCSLALLAQLISTPHQVSVEPSPAPTAHRGSTLDVPLKLTIRLGHHINSNTPAEDYLIPTALTWDAGPLAPRGVTYPKAESVRYEFAEKPLLVYSGTITIASRFTVPSSAPHGPLTLTGRLRYQACTDKMCLPPRTLPVSVPVKIDD